MHSFEIRKTAGMWELYRNGNFIARCETKKEATLVNEMFNAPRDSPSQSVAIVEWYKYKKARYAKKFDARDTFRMLSSDCRSFGIMPGHVGVDPDTGEFI